MDDLGWVGSALFSASATTLPSGDTAGIPPSGKRRSTLPVAAFQTSVSPCGDDVTRAPVGAKAR